MKEKSELVIANDRLKREVNDSRKMSRRNSTRAQTANTGLTRPMISRIEVLRLRASVYMWGLTQCQVLRSLSSMSPSYRL